MTCPLSSGQVKAIEIHHLVPRSHEVTHELLASSRHMHRPPRWLGAGSSNRRRDRRGWPVHLRSPVWRSRPSNTFSAVGGRLPLVLMSSRFTKKSLVNVSRPVGEDTEVGLLEVRVQGAHATDKNRHLGSGQCHELCPVHQQVLRGATVSVPEVVAEAVCGRFEHGKRLRVGLLLRRIRATRREGNFYIVAGILGGLLDGCAPAQNDQVGERNLLAAGLRAVEVLLDRLQSLAAPSPAGPAGSLPSPSAGPGECARRSLHRACRCRGTSPPTPRRSRPAGRSTVRKRGSWP